MEQEQKQKQESGGGESTNFVEVPTMLHMDKEAYDSLVLMSRSDEAIENAVKDLQWNPSLSYLGIEDPNYLYGENEFIENTSEQKREKAKTETNAQRNNQRQRLGDMKGEGYHSIVNSSIVKEEKTTTGMMTVGTVLCKHRTVPCCHRTVPFVTRYSFI